MAGYEFSHKWRREDFFLRVDDSHEQVQINLGPNVGDMTIGYDPPRRGRVIPMAVHQDEAYEDVKMADHEADLLNGQSPKAA